MNCATYRIFYIFILHFIPPERFLKDVFDLVGCHHERLLVSLRTACSTLEPSTMEEAAIITQLLYQLAAHVGYLLVEMLGCFMPDDYFSHKYFS